MMLQASKTIAVSSTAAATLQQLVVSTFERIAIDDSKLLVDMPRFIDLFPNLLLETPDSSKQTVNVVVDDNTVTIGHFSYDALRVRQSLYFETALS